MAVTLKEGDKAPNFKGLDQNGNEIKLTDFKDKNLILYFYPEDDTPGCVLEACDFRDNYQMWLSKGYSIVGVSPDDAASHQRFIEKYQLPFPLIADPDKKILNAYTTWGEKNLYGHLKIGVLRTTFIIDGKGIITKIFKKPKLKAHSEQILSYIDKK